jgi:hypothetical protein
VGGGGVHRELMGVERSSYNQIPGEILGTAGMYPLSNWTKQVEDKIRVNLKIRLAKSKSG